jgi:peptidoglycan/xylan/chitin deacetylase (PgdA/CDA1 family)
VALTRLFERYGVVPTVYLCSQLVDSDRRFWFTVAEDPEPLKALPNSERLATLARTSGFSPTRAYVGSGRETLNRNEIRTLAATCEFGSHTRFHPILPTCSDEDAETEITHSKVELESITEMECHHFSYPNGAYTERDVELAKSAGYRSARTMDVGWNDASSDPFRLKVLGVSDQASINRLAADLSGATSNIARLRQAIAR